MFPIIQIGPLSLQATGLILIVGVWAGLSAVEYFAKKHHANAAAVSNLILLGLAAGIAGARLSYAAANIPAFSGNWGSLFSLTPTMLDPVGGFAVGLITSLIYAQRKRLDLWTTLDALTPGFAIFMMFAGIADLASGKAYGLPTTLPWGIDLWGEKRHPTQIYTSLAALVTLAVYFWQQRRSSRPRGILFLTWLSLTAIFRIFIKPFQADSLVWGHGFRAAQVAGWLVLAFALYLLGRRFREGAADPSGDATTQTVGGEQ